ncbi:DUF1559 family PulG-like putative transporter [Phycisphaera mikurensis]|uniref:DUF1559 domain-containing protein n=1 Tax=Phycisphaera mikurensis (strain NBRC 102666 / KCTC 22515 / FYK2301M01) TaxID=1142394 RepID=I0IEU8_PHYMF|nr:DUF1559 domain-containing protein [Phycisphaera mikurensis]MBB6441581.1 prepilin-type N-terminal cleavage/methylation domain-containing protein/prepilin-type processing-associated H-X9-DG protein [Phycisphaera mikurensis]BAM03786.1 hypothetical protein PSMK_16270 [Phycisphaera mikurensis NBRC 102666]
MSKTSAPPRVPSGFTLIELLVVISIIALLIGILLPALGAARATARQIACASGIRQITLATMMYTDDNEGHFPAGTAPGGGTFAISYDDLIADYDGRGSLGQTLRNRQFLRVSERDSSFYKCPSDDSEPAFAFGTPPSPVQIRSYSITLGAPNPNPANAYPVGISGNGWSTRLAEVKSATTTIGLAENRTRTAAGDAQNHVGNFLDSNVPPFAHHQFPERLEQHDGKGNYSYLDGHVSIAKFEDTLNGAAPGGGYGGTQWDFRQLPRTSSP